MKNGGMWAAFGLAAAGMIGIFVASRGGVGTANAAVISTGERVFFGDHLEGPDDIVVFQFTADWCGPCQEVKPRMHDLVSQFSNVHYKFIDVVSWETEATEQLWEDFDGDGIPFFVVYDGDGDCLALGSFNDVHDAIVENGFEKE